MTTKYAIIKAYGQQFKVSEGDKIQANFVDVEAGSTVSFDEVLLLSQGSSVTVGQPTVKGAKVTATVVNHTHGDKVLVFKYLRKNKSKTLRGHKQPYSVLSINSIEG